MPELEDLLGSIQRWELAVSHYPVAFIARKFAEITPTVYDVDTLTQLRETVIKTILRLKGPLAVEEFVQELQKR